MFALEIAHLAHTWTQLLLWLRRDLAAFSLFFLDFVRCLCGRNTRFRPKTSSLAGTGLDGFGLRFHGLLDHLRGKLVIPVDFKVLFQVPFEPELAATYVAPVRLLTGVDAHVFGDVDFVEKGLVADVAPILFLLFRSLLFRFPLLE